MSRVKTPQRTNNNQKSKKTKKYKQRVNKNSAYLPKAYEKANYKKPLPKQ